MLRDCRENVNREPIGVRHVRGREIDAAFHQVRNESHVARQAIELDN